MKEERRELSVSSMPFVTFLNEKKKEKKNKCIHMMLDSSGINRR
jgi:hypothetical protein